MYSCWLNPFHYGSHGFCSASPSLLTNSVTNFLYCSKWKCYHWKLSHSHWQQHSMVITFRWFCLWISPTQPDRSLPALHSMVQITFRWSVPSNPGKQLVFNQSGYIYILRDNNQTLPLQERLESSADFYFRATLNFDWVFMLILTWRIPMPMEARLRFGLCQIIFVWTILHY